MIDDEPYIFFTKKNCVLKQFLWSDEKKSEILNEIVMVKTLSRWDKREW